MHLDLLPGRLAIYRLPADDPAPEGTKCENGRRALRDYVLVKEENLEKAVSAP